jgi:uncharacterized protein YprB with RNaseH-like and TPR domain
LRDTVHSALSDEIRVRLRQLRHAAVGPPSFAPARAVAPPNADRRLAEDWVERGVEIANDSGVHLRLRRPLGDVHRAAAVASTRASLDHAPAVPHDELAALGEHFPERVAFLDLETCGFAGSTVFLAGLVWQADGVQVVDQLFARNYAEERALLETLWQSLAGIRVLVTFNGKSFDWPMVRDRSVRHRLWKSLPDKTAATQGEPLIHCDLLHHARRRWKHVLPDCRLQTLERYVCNRRRVDDLAGGDVPEAYHAFVRTGQGRSIGAILRHNARDLFTLAELALRLVGNERCPRRA